MFGMRTTSPTKRRHLAFHLGPTAHAPGTSAAARYAGRIHGEDEGQEDNPGSTEENEPNYGAGDQGASFNPALDDGGEDPFANVEQPGDPQYDTRLATFTDPEVDDTWDPPDQVETLRNPRVDFGGELYSGFGPAAIIGGEDGFGERGPMSLIAGDLDESLFENSPDWSGDDASLIGAEPSTRMARMQKPPAHHKAADAHGYIAAVKINGKERYATEVGPSGYVMGFDALPLSRAHVFPNAQSARAASSVYDGAYVLKVDGSRTRPLLFGLW